MQRMFRPSREGIAPVLVAIVLSLTSACSSTRSSTNTNRSWTEQLLVTTAADRALARLNWPRLDGLDVFVETVTPGANQDAAYLTAAARKHLSLQGASLVDDRQTADVVATLLSGSLGTQQSETLVGVPKMQSLTIPVPFPEIAFYKKTLQNGFAKTEVMMRDGRSGALFHREGPSQGRAYSAEYRVLLLSFVWSDVPEEDPLRPGPADRLEDRLE